MVFVLWPVEIDGRRFNKCATPDCFRAVPGSSAHCCFWCGVAAAGRHEIDEHSPGCEQRWAERRPYVLGGGRP